MENALTQRQQEVKNLLFKKKPQDQPRPTQDTVKKERPQAPAPQVDQQIEAFMKDMNGEFKKMNDGTLRSPGAVSRDMLHHQNEVLISHAKLMNENQQVLKNLLQKANSGKSGGASVDIGKAMVQELMKPLVGQVEDIKQIYEDTRRCANEVNETLNGIKKSKKLDLDGQPEKEKDFVDKFGNYMVAATD